MLALALVLIGLAACGESGRSPTASGPNAAPPEAATTDDGLPAALLGTYDTDADACAQGMTSGRLTVRTDTLDFFYGFAVVDEVSAHDGGYQVETTLYQTEGAVEVVPEPTSYRIERTADGLRIESAYAGASALVRCADAQPGVASGTAASRADVQSAYTQIESCETLREAEVEAGTTEQRCPGYGGVALFVSEGDLRTDVDAGVPNGSWDTPAGFKSVGKTVEWRLRDGRPFPAIVRYEVEGTGGTVAERQSDLAVVTVGREGAPGCLVGYVPADAEPDQNTAARRLADRDAEGHDCDADRG